MKWSPWQSMKWSPWQSIKSGGETKKLQVKVSRLELRGFECELEEREKAVALEVKWRGPDNNKPGLKLVPFFHRRSWQREREESESKMAVAEKLSTNLSKDGGEKTTAMAFSTATRSNIPSSSSFRNSKFCYLRHNGSRNKLVFGTALRRRSRSLKIVKSVLDNTSPSVSDNGATEPARILLERLFVQTQKLEEHMSRDSHLPQDVQLGLNLGTLEADLMAALEVLKDKEDELQNAEKTVHLEHGELNRAKKELEQREKEVTAARHKYEKIEEELNQANLNLTSQARQIEDLKLHLKERDRDIGAAQSALSLKEEEMDKMRNELAKKSEEAARIDSELKSKAQLLTQANKIVNEQEIELQGLRKDIREKEKELEAYLTLRKLEEEKLKVAKSNLEKQTMEWLEAQEELKKLAEEASKHVGETYETVEDFRRVKKLLSDVRFELVSSQKALTSSRQKTEEQDKLLGKQLAELEEQKISVMLYMENLKAAQIEIETERVKLRVAEARNKDLEWDLSMERELVKELQEELQKERSLLQQAMQEMSSFQKELDQKSTEFEKAHNLLQVKESELVEAKMEIQHLKSEQASLELVLDEKDSELLSARKKLEEVSEEVADLKMLLNGKENQLIQATTLLQEKDEHVGIIQNELNDTKQKFLDAETVVGRIVELTNKLVMSMKDEDYGALSLSDDPAQELFQLPWEEVSDDFRLQKRQLETELELTKESLRRKEMDVLTAQRSLAIKDEELKLVIGRLDAKEREIEMMKEEMERDANDLRKLYALAQQRVGEKSVGDVAIEKLQIEAAQLEVEAATSALDKLAEMSRELLNKATMSIEAGTDTGIFPVDSFDAWTSIAENNECFTKVKSQVLRLSALTEELVKEAGIAG
ncbi:hypothetical protein L484_004505 [Morus notabilis]|uniref:Uncharacterized protein n=2 Tax=Morus notabilis TaxID=981085 RepID=W9QLD1_9ROSA|nr:hypothetical protein L484_004505 [Morus notabilis]